jgi:excisionase family DNA binding protein
VNNLERRFYSFNDLPTTLNADDIAEYLGISRAGAYNLLRSEGFPTLKIGKRMVVQKEKFKTWCDEHSA